MSEDFHLQTRGLCGRTFGPVSLALRPGETLVLLAPTREMGVEWTDCALGLAEPVAGSVALLGHDLAGMAGTERRRLLARTAYVSPPPGSLLSNLKVWENIVLPACYHGPGADDSTEATVIAALATAGLTGTWLDRHLPSTPDRLDPFEARAVALARAAVSQADLLVGEFLFDDLEPRYRRRLVALLDWMRDRRPALGIVLVLLADDPTEEIGLIPGGRGGIISLQAAP